MRQQLQIGSTFARNVRNDLACSIDNNGFSSSGYLGGQIGQVQFSIVAIGSSDVVGKRWVFRQPSIGAPALRGGIVDHCEDVGRPVINNFRPDERQIATGVV